MVYILLNYIVKKNNGKIAREYTGGGCSKRHEYLVVTMNGKSKRYDVGNKFPSVMIMNKQYIFYSEELVKDFAIKTNDSVHQPDDRFATLDDASLAWGLTYNLESIANKVEYISIIYGADKKYKYTDPLSGRYKGADVPPTPKGETLKAVIHSHSGYDKDYNDELFSGEDKNVAIINGKPIYLTTPAGNVKKKRWLLQQWIQGLCKPAWGAPLQRVHCISM